jgi:hypothetical protein
VNDAAAVISALPARAARLLAVEILLAEPEALGDDVLEACLYLLRERLSEGDVPDSGAGVRGARRSKEPLWILRRASGGGRLRADRAVGDAMTGSCRRIRRGRLLRHGEQGNSTGFGPAAGTGERPGRSFPGDNHRVMERGERARLDR